MSAQVELVFFSVVARIQPTRPYLHAFAVGGLAALFGIAAMSWQMESVWVFTQTAVWDYGQDVAILILGTALGAWFRRQARPEIS